MMRYKVLWKTENVFLLCKQVASAVFGAIEPNVADLPLLLTYKY